jgi:membrane protein involved in colicin uptake
MIKWTKPVFISEIKSQNPNLFFAANAKAAAETKAAAAAAAAAKTKAAAERVSEAAAAAAAERVSEAAAERVAAETQAAAERVAAETKAAAAETKAAAERVAAETKAAAERVAAETQAARTRSTLSLKLNKLPDGYYDGGKRRQIKITKKNKRSKIIGARCCTRRSRRISCRRGKKFRLGRR